MAKRRTTKKSCKFGVSKSTGKCLKKPRTKKSKRGKKSTRKCNPALGKRAVSVKNHGRHCPGHARRR